MSEHTEADHDSRCEREYTENGYVFIDCLCHIRRAKAEAWDEGFKAAEDVRDLGTWTDNPYRPGNERRTT